VRRRAARQFAATLHNACEPLIRRQTRQEGGSAAFVELVVDQRDKLGVIVSYDDPEILPTRKPRAVSKALTLDGDVVTARREGGQKRHPQVVIFAADKEQMSPH
jgi:hypothetical protein